MTKSEAIRHACETVGLAYHSIGDYSEPSDGFCDKCPTSLISDCYYRNSGRALEFVRLAVVEKLKRDGHQINRHFHSETGNLEISYAH